MKKLFCWTNSTNRIALLLFLLLALPHGLLAEFRCTAEIKYRWQKGDNELTAFWARVEKRGETETAAKEMLQKTIDRERVRASEACTRQHQNLSGCISSKMNAYSELLQGLTFSARSKLEDSVALDCEKAQGICKGIEISEIQCIDLNPPPPSEEAEESDKKKRR